MTAVNVDRVARHNLVRLVLIGLHDPTRNPGTDAQDRRNGVAAAMDLLAYIEGLEVELEATRRRLMHSDAELQAKHSRIRELKTFAREHAPSALDVAEHENCSG